MALNGLAYFVLVCR